ncbi:MAG: Trk system potassium transporter TrkA [Chloroflexota bacterium]
MRILIIGAGDIGFQLANRLSRQKHDITMIEADPQRVKRASEQLDANIINGNGASYRVLEQANLDGVEIVAAMTDRDEVNLLSCKLAKKIGVPTTIARVRHPQFTQPDFILDGAELGTDLIIHPEKETADSAISLIHHPSATYAVELEDGRIELLGLTLAPESPLLDIPFRDFEQHLDHLRLRVVAVNRKYTTVIPQGDTVLKTGDQVFAVCDPDYSAEFIKLTGRIDAEMKDIMIVGGGLIGRFIADSLAQEAQVKIIEQDRNRAEELADILPHALVIHGDGTDIDLLEQEGLDEMDAFVAVTGDDENNIITTLLAQHSRVKRAISLVNKAQYLTVASRIGVDAVISKQLLTVNTVERYIQQEVASIADLPGIEAQLIEYIVSDGCDIAASELRDCRFPRDAIVGAVLRQNEVFIPHGDTRLQAGDKVVVFALPEAMTQLDKLFTRVNSRKRISRFLPI